MKIGLVGYPGCGKSSVFDALTGLAAGTGYAARAGRGNLGVVKVPDVRVDRLAALYHPRKITYAEIAFTDLPAGRGPGLDRAALNAMRELDALCQVLRAFPGAEGEPPRPLREIEGLETEAILADLEIAEQRLARLQRERGDSRELERLERIAAWLGEGRPLRSLPLPAEEHKAISGFAFLTLKPLLLVLNVPEEQVTDPPPTDLEGAARQRGLGLVVLSARVEMEIAQLPEEEQPEFVGSLGLAEPARDRFVRAAYALVDLVSMLTVGPDEVRAWPLPRGTPAPRAAGKIHSDIERGFIRAEVVPWTALLEHGSEAKCREAGVARVEGKDYRIQDGDVVHFRFNV